MAIAPAGAAGSGAAGLGAVSAGKSGIAQQLLQQLHAKKAKGVNPFQQLLQAVNSNSSTQQIAPSGSSTAQTASNAIANAVGSVVNVLA